MQMVFPCQGANIVDLKRYHDGGYGDFDVISQIEVADNNGTIGNFL